MTSHKAVHAVDGRGHPGDNEYDPKYECCNLQQTERGIRAKDFFKLEEI